MFPPFLIATWVARLDSFAAFHFFSNSRVLRFHAGWSAREKSVIKWIEHVIRDKGGSLVRESWSVLNYFSVVVNESTKVREGFLKQKPRIETWPLFPFFQLDLKW